METHAVVSMKPIILPAPGRGDDLRVRVSAPATGSDLPVIVFSHGFGSSMDGYAPLADFWAANGFAVLQPTYLDSRTQALAPDDSRTPRIWRHRVEDLKRTLDHLGVFEAALSRRFDRGRIAVAGHSWGAQTSSTALGARVLAPAGDPDEDFSDPRVKAGVLLAMAGRGGADLSPFAAEHYPFMNPDFERMTTPALVVAGDRDDSPMTDRGWEWTTDAYFLSPGEKSLLTVFGGEHSLGGIPGYTVTETTDENPERVALLQRSTTAYLRYALDIDPEGWPADTGGMGDIKRK